MRFLSLAVMVLTAAVAQAGIIPVGVQNDVSYNTVVNDWGWTVTYRGDYDDFAVPINTVFQNTTGKYVMVAAIQDGSDRFDVLAAALASDVRTYTAHNQTHTANGVEWYYNAYSIGFAGLGDTISQGQADTSGPTERDRLSWHATTGGNYTGFDHTQQPQFIDGGWRSGTNRFLNNDSGWDRVILTLDAQDESSVPEPASLAIWGLGALGCAAAAYRRKRLAA